MSFIETHCNDDSVRIRLLTGAPRVNACPLALKILGDLPSLGSQGGHAQRCGLVSKGRRGGGGSLGDNEVHTYSSPSSMPPPPHPQVSIPHWLSWP